MSSGAPTPDGQALSGTPQTIPTTPMGHENAATFQNPSGVPQFFANPFMSPFMPQQVDGTTTTPMPSMFFSPAQYQEMMQQYFQQMMVASQFGGTMPFPMPFMAPNMSPARPASQASQPEVVNEVVNSMRNSSLISENGHHEIPTATVAPIVTDQSITQFEEELQEPLKKDDPDDQIGEPQPSTANHSPSLPANKKPEALPTGDNDSTNSPSPATSEPRKASNSEDERTTSLIRKQMSEIEKEIARRSQNKNIKKIDDREMAELIGSSVVTVPTVTSSMVGMDYQSTAAFAAQAGLPYTAPPPPSSARVSPPKETLNQLRSSFNLPETGPAPAQPAPYVSPAPLPFIQPQMPSQMASQQFINPFLQPFPAQPAPIGSNGSVDPFSPTTDQLAAAFAAPAHVQTNSSMGLAPPPPPSHPVQRKTSSPSTSGDANSWPEENKENDDDPVWVLRDSYLKRMQRDEQAQQQQQQQQNEWGQEVETRLPEVAETEEQEETDRLINAPDVAHQDNKKKSSKETMVHEPAVLIEGVLFRARYLGSTQMVSDTRGSKAARMGQAQEAVARVKAPDGEIQPSTEIDLFISTEKIMVLNTDLQDILMDHALRTISYIADIGDLVVLMARRMSPSDSDEHCSQIEGVKRTPKVICHVFESDEASFIAQSIGQAFQVAYVEFLRANGIDDPSYLRQIDYQEVLNSQELLGDELEMFARKETQKDVVVPKKNGEMLGIVVVESGWGSMLPTVVLAHMNPAGPAARSNQLNIGDQIININGISLVGLPLSAAQTNIKNAKSATAVRLTVVSTPPVVEVRIRRPDTKYQLGFSVQNGVICSLLRGGIAERGGIRVGHRIIEINGHSVVAVAHDRIVNMLATAIGEIHMKTMPTSMFRLLTGQEVPQYI